MNTAQVMIVLYFLVELRVSGETLNETLKLTKENEAEEYMFGVSGLFSKTIAINNRLIVISSPIQNQGWVDIFSRKDNKRIAKLRSPPSSPYRWLWIVRNSK